jgi:hypothetical protein
MSQSAVLFALSFTGKDKERWLENYWIKNRNAVNRGKEGTSNAWVIPADQHSKANAAEAVAGLQAQGVEIHKASSLFTAGGVTVKPGDWIIRGDQPYRTVVDMYFAVQDYSMSNPSPYDDLGWTYPMMRNIVSHEINDKAILTAAMTPVTGAIRATGGISGTGSTLIVEHRRQPARAVPLPVRHGADAGSRGGIRSGRPQVRRGCADHRQREPCADRAGADRTGTLRICRRERADGQDA